MSVLYCAVYLIGTGFLFFAIGRLLPKNIMSYDTWLFRERRWEKQLYTLMKLSVWQSRLPDMSRLFKKRMPAKRLNGMPGNEQLLIMIKETCVAEYIHTVLCFTGLFCLRLWPGMPGVILSVLYVLFGNIPFIMVQRYNRPRLIHLLENKRRRDLKRCGTTERHKALILSGNTGEGHNSCAEAIREAYTENREPCDIMDGLSFFSAGVSRLISRVHVFLYRYMPQLYSSAYYRAEKHPLAWGNSRLFDRFTRNASEHFYAFLLDHDYDTVICTHFFPTFLMAKKMPELKRLKINTGFVTTDQTCYPMVGLGCADRYFIPDAIHIREFEATGIPAEKIVVSGIPVRSGFYKTLDRETACGRAQIPPNARHLLVMGGSMGCRSVMRTVALLAFKLKKDQYITVVCGNNKRLARKLKRQYMLNKRIRILGYVSDISALMDSADAYLTKPGGLSTAEAAVKNLPMVLMNAVAGCEKYNLLFYTKRGLAVTSRSVGELAGLCRKLLDDPAATDAMRTAGRELIRVNSAAVIRNTMNDARRNKAV